MAATKEKGLAKADDRLKKSDFREKLRSMRSIPLLKKNETEKKTGPLIAKPTLQFTQKSSCTTQHKNDIPRYRGSRTPSPPRSESTFTRQAVHNYRSFSPGPPSRRSRSPTYTRSSSPSSPSSSRRTPSPTGFDTAFQEEIKKRVQKVLRARLYLLQQIGPNSFMIGGDSPMHKFRVIIGPQSCSCGHGPHCVHLLFVMLRVFQVSESDARLWSRTLKNYEVESLFKNYHARRDIRVKNCNSFKDIKTQTSISSNHPNLAESKSEMSNKDEEEICPICLLEMLDGESLVSCEVGCHNKLHHHCIAIWAEECRRQKEPVICPLCRAEWRKHKESNRESSRQRILSSNRMQRNSESVFRENDIVLPNAELIPQKYLAIALPWTQIFGEEVVACLFSQDWMSREIALRYLSKEIKSLFATSQNNSVSSLQESRPQEILHSCCSVLAYMAGDSFYKVFIASLKCLRSMLAYVSCQNEQDLTLLQENLRPFIKTILLKCADNNRRTSQLSISTLMELCRGQRGELAIGRETSFAWQDGIGGVGYLLSCIMENDNSDTLSCQGLLGRLFAIDKLMEEFPRDFCLLYIKGRQSNSSQVHISDTDNLVNYERLISLINFSVNAISNQHSTVSKIAKHVFLSVSRRATHIPSVFSEFCEKLQILEPGIQHRLLRRLRVIAQEFQAATATPTSNRPSIFNDDADWLQIKNNKKLINNKLNSSEFFHDHVNKSYKEFKINNLEVGQDLLTPPATPEHHFQRSLSVPIISSFHSQNIEKLEERDLIDFSEPPEKQKSNIINGKVDKSAFSNKAAISKEEKLIPPSTLNISSNSLNTSTSDDLSDLTDITMTQFCDDQMITFKSEVTTPKNSPTHQPSRVLLHLCKEELEEEEAIALAIAMETSTQEALPHIPGLSSDNSDEVITIHLQPEMGENDYHPHIYLENIHWVRGPLLGTGAYSSCYQVRDVKSGTLMAVKQVSFCRNSSDEQQRVTQAIKEEIVMMAKLHHPNVLRIMGATQQRGHFNMFVEWMPGGSVAGLLDKYGTFAESVIINYTQQVLRGLAYLHDNHILHRDLKGANLLVDSTGQHLRIGDFGAAARLASHATGAGEFQGQLLGTIAFMAPEVLRGEDYGRNCDIWSVGCVMIEMATAKPPWNAHDLSNHLALIFKIACSTGPPSIPDHLSPAARDLALRCLERNSEDRPPAKELLKHPVFHLNTT